MHELAAELHAAWPPLTPNLHALDFEGGRVQLLLALGEVTRLLPALRAEPDAFFLDGFAPVRDPQVWQPRLLKALGRMAAPGATLATWSVASELRHGLVSAGFDVQAGHGKGGQHEITLARYAPRFERPRRPGAAAAAAGSEAVVIGAGIAGAAAAKALLQAGLQVTVVDTQSVPAAQASGNPAGLFHGTVHPHDGPHARLFRAAALMAQRDYGAAFNTGAVAGNAAGLLRLGDRLPAMQALLREQGLPSGYVQALDAAASSALAGVPLPGPAWFYPGAGWLAAADWVRLQLSQPGLRWRPNTAVAALSRGGQGWLLHDAQGRTIADVPIVVLANAAGVVPLVAQLGHAPWPLQHSRGQVTLWTQASAARLRMPVAGDGYAIPMAADGSLLCGATREAGEPSTDPDIDGGSAPLRAADDRHNIDRLKRLTGLIAPAEPARWSGRAGWRLQTADRLPIAGALPASTMPFGQRLDQGRLLPRESGLFVLTALGARGLTLAPLLGRLVAAQASGAPWPLEQDLADAIDPARWLVRADRRPGTNNGSQA